MICDRFRETITNVVVHRTWDVNTPITVFRFEDRIEISSPGGLVEKLGTGILRIRNAYKDSFAKSAF